MGCILEEGSGTPKIVTEVGKEGCEPERKDAMFTPANKGLGVGTSRQWSLLVNLSRMAVISRTNTGCDHKREDTDRSRLFHTQKYHLISIIQKSWFSLSRTRKGEGKKIKISGHSVGVIRETVWKFGRPNECSSVNMD